MTKLLTKATSAKNKGPTMASLEFKEAVTESSTLCSILCEHCGRAFFVIGREAGDYYEDELEDLKSQEEENGDRYISSPYPIPWGYLDGKQTVVDCPCGAMDKYEEFIWDHRNVIADYLKDRTKMELKIAQFESDEMKSIPLPL